MVGGDCGEDGEGDDEYDYGEHEAVLLFDFLFCFFSLCFDDLVGFASGYNADFWGVGIVGVWVGDDVFEFSFW